MEHNSTKNNYVNVHTGELVQAVQASGNKNTNNLREVVPSEQLLHPNALDCKAIVFVLLLPPSYDSNGSQPVRAVTHGDWIVKLDDGKMFRVETNSAFQRQYLSVPDVLVQLTLAKRASTKTKIEQLNSSDTCLLWIRDHSLPTVGYYSATRKCWVVDQVDPTTGHIQTTDLNPQTSPVTSWQLIQK